MTITFAQSLDGRIATASGMSQWISGPATLELAHRLRNDHDAVMVGIGTVLADNPELTCRLEGGQSPLRVILDSRLRTPVSAKVVQTAGDIATMVFTSNRHDADAAAALRSFGVQIVAVDEPKPGMLDLRQVLRELSRRDVATLLIEGGSATITSVISAGLWDRMVAVMAPMVIGKGTDTVGDLGVIDLQAAPRARTVRVYQAGQDVVWEMERENGE